MIRLQDVNVIFNPGTNLTNHVLKSINLTIEEGDFVTVLGGNGAGKSTLMNVLAGDILPSSGKIIIDEQDVTNKSSCSRSGIIARVFQDPMLGTCANLTIEENLAMASKRGQNRLLLPAINQNLRDNFKDVLFELNIGLEDRLDDQVAMLSGGQRQVLSLVMATLNPCKILLLDEHTAALDPKMAELVMNLTASLYSKRKLTILMITHNISHALNFGNKTIIMQQGSMIKSLAGNERESITAEMLLHCY